ncbi:MAG TPA: His/Gly/Thr/Pro-type tRNA ligase C-terminal domain-containing protein, partial [Thermovirgaceae bacterium]|nr:His/Gly/Thr/Pro-type tRNA ligase C-terminal domain-containing protein [Thermovirgaceae bacterium]
RQPLLDAFVVCSEEGIRDEAVKLLYELRSAGIAADIDYSGRSFKAQFKFAGGSGASFACVMGPEEVSSGSVTVKDLESGEQRRVARGDVASAIMASGHKNG